MALVVDIRKRLGDFTLQVCMQAGEGVTGILGASGSGKSLTLRCIAGVEKPDEGRIELDGTVFFDSEKHLDLPPQKRQVGLLFQNYALFPNMTVRQNLLAGLRVWERDKKTAAVQVEDMIERFQLTGLERHRPFQLSGGQQQRVALARILLSRPGLLLLDEPFSALDGFLKWNLELELLRVLEEFGGSTLFVSHSRNEIYRLCSQVCVMEQGMSGPVLPVRQLFEQPASRAAALLSGCKNYSRARQAGKTEVFAEDWGVTLTYRGKALQEFRYIGVRSHYLTPISAKDGKKQENVFHCRIMHVVEDVFSMVLIVRPSALPEGSGIHRQEEQLRVEVTKEFWKEFCGKEDLSEGLRLFVKPEDVMLLS